MFFFNEKEDMGLNASLSLLDLSSGATIDDANQAYTYLHRMIDLFHRDNDAEHGDRQEDLELLACAYEKAVSFLSDQHSTPTDDHPSQASEKMNDVTPPTTDLHFTINFSGAGDEPLPADDSALPPAAASETVDDAVAIISRRLQEAESSLERAREAVEKATAAMDAASQRLEKTKQDRMNAMIAAKTARSRALLMEIEVKRATEEAIEIAEKVRDRVSAAKEAAKAAKIEADKAQDQIHQFLRTEEAAAAEAVCAEDRLEQAKQQLKTLAHTVVQARSQLRIFHDYERQLRSPAASSEEEYEEPFSEDASASPQSAEYLMDTRQQILSDLMEIEDSLNVRRQARPPASPACPQMRETSDPMSERRQHERLYYPESMRPLFAFEGRTIPVLDLSHTGIRLASDAWVGQSHLVRGAIIFNGLPTMNVTGRVVHQDGQGLGLRLATRIGNHILDQERRRLAG